MPTKIIEFACILWTKYGMVEVTQVFLHSWHDPKL